MNKKFILLIVVGIITFPLYAQNLLTKKWEHEIVVGLNIGGTMPIPLPAEIRKIRSFSPNLNPVIAFSATRWINNSKLWGITSGFNIDYKGFTEQADVKYMYTKLNVGEGENAGTYSGTFSGKNETKVKNGYFTIPLMAAYHPWNDLIFRLGGYISYLHTAKFEGTATDGYIRDHGPTGQKTNVDYAEFDFSDDVRNIDAGLSASVEWAFSNSLSLAGQLNWGLVPVFPSNFEGISHKMYNVYASFGIAYRLGK